MLAAGVVTVAASLSSVAAVHEHVHQWAGQQQQEWQRPKKVGAVFAEQKVHGDSADDEETDGISGAPKRRRAIPVGVFRVCMVVIHQLPPKVQVPVLAVSIRRHA